MHAKTAVSDNEKAQNFFRSLVKDPITSTEIKENFEELRSMLKESSANQIKLGQVLGQMENNVIKIAGIVARDKKE